MNEETCIYVYADWLSDNPVLIGRLYASKSKGKEMFSFAYDNQWIRQCAENDYPTVLLDPDLPLQRGRQYLSMDKKLFGMFSDSCPDRWGRLLMKRKEAIIARKEARKPKTLNESDFLLGVYDKARMGGLRFSLTEGGEFLACDESLTVPPWENLRKLETASLAFENGKDEEEEKWLNQLLAPGSSLGGARPKATVKAVDGSLWIAKFPAAKDEWNIGAWEMVVHELAVKCGLNVPEAKLQNFSDNGSTYLSKRFDRLNDKRIHFASAMTLIGKTDSHEPMDFGYLDIAEFIMANGAHPKEDLRELWKRIVFGMSVSNTDDHLRNHGFLLTKNGWILSPMYDVNPNIYGNSLSLNVGIDDNSMDFDLAIEVCEYFGITKREAEDIVAEVKKTVDENWKQIAQTQGLSKKEIERMSPAFSLELK